MTRSERLLQLLQALRRYRHPVSGRVLASDIGVSIRTLYRDIASLQAQGAQIEGEAGVGYVLRPGFMLPPLMFSADEIEALVLGSRWVARRADDQLGAAAKDALAKIAAVIPTELRDELERSTLLVGTAAPLEQVNIDIAQLREAIRAERKVHITYADVSGAGTDRTVWPFGLGFFDRVQIVLAWCELRQAFRHFRLDRISDMQVSGSRYQPRRQVLLKRWRASEKLPM
ncbi:YafY family protein [Devosia rhodophyticola]|uniref:YafY family protein n=1 Tax=Devosia rhodophyticola TaxID=3026423 RepID=A0ABY7YUF6_9HYPH|nr:YafY family protein [Devosia rhodophyticola]WDR04675.1 YafY family protein [Devosia rhodophyticola]